MATFKKIFVYLEPQQEEQPALDRAQFLARASGASLHLFLCAYDTAISVASFFSGGQRENLIRTVVDGNQALVDRLAAPLRGDGLEVTTEVVWDKQPIDAALLAADRECVDLFLKKAQVHARVPEMIFSHGDWSLMRCSSSPVMLVKDGQWDDVGQVLAVVDAAPEDADAERLNDEILTTAQHLAAMLDFELHLVCAYPAPPVFVPLSHGAEQLKSYRAKMSQMVESRVAEMGRELGVPEQRLHTREGPSDWVIASVSAELVAEFVIMGNVARQGLTGRTMGRNCEDCLDALNTNVLIINVDAAEEHKLVPGQLG